MRKRGTCTLVTATKPQPVQETLVQPPCWSNYIWIFLFVAGFKRIIMANFNVLNFFALTFHSKVITQCNGYWKMSPCTCPVNLYHWSSSQIIEGHQNRKMLCFRLVTIHMLWWNIWTNCGNSTQEKEPRRWRRQRRWSSRAIEKTRVTDGHSLNGERWCCVRICSPAHMCFSGTSKFPFLSVSLSSEF